MKNFQWTNDDQNQVAKSIAEDKLSPEAAAKKWVDANKDKVQAWLKSPAAGRCRVRIRPAQGLGRGIVAL